MLNRESLEKLYGDAVIRLNSPQGFCQHLSQSTRCASRTVTLFCHNLNPLIWAQQQVVDAISAIARKSGNSRIQILLQDSKPISGRTHPLITLCQRLSSKVQIKVLNADIPAVDYAYGIIDNRQLLYFNNEALLNGFMNYCAPAECRSLNEEFDRLWHYGSTSDPNLSQLYL